MEIIPFHIDADENDDTLFKFKVLNNSKENPKIYSVEITIDEMNDSLLVKEFCQCDDFKYRKHRCKHLAYCLETLKKYTKVLSMCDIRENEEERKEYEKKYDINLPKDLNTNSN